MDAGSFESLQKRCARGTAIAATLLAGCMSAAGPLALHAAQSSARSCSALAAVTRPEALAPDERAFAAGCWARSGRVERAARAYLSLSRTSDVGKLLRSHPSRGVIGSSAQLVGPKHFPPLLEIEVRGVRGLAMLDTGADASAFDPAFLARVGAANLHSPGFHAANAAQTISAELFAVHELRIGPLYVPELLVLALPLGQLGDPGGRIVAVIGANVLNSVEYAIDFRARELRVGPGAAGQGAALGGSFQHNLYLLDARLDGARVSLLLDTGASNSALERELLRRIEREGEVRTLGVGTFATVGGAEQRALEAIRIERLQLGPLTASGLLAVDPYVSRIGMDYLEDKVLGVNAREGVVRIQ